MACCNAAANPPEEPCIWLSSIEEGEGEMGKCSSGIMHTRLAIVIQRGILLFALAPPAEAWLYSWSAMRTAWNAHGQASCFWPGTVHRVGQDLSWWRGCPASKAIWATFCNCMSIYYGAMQSACASSPRPAALLGEQPAPVGLSHSDCASSWHKQSGALRYVQSKATLVLLLVHEQMLGGA